MSISSGGPVRARSGHVAATLSFWMPGLGQLYAACWSRGAVIGAGSALLTWLAWQQLPPTALWEGRSPESPALAGLLWSLSLAVWLWNIPDARRRVCAPAGERGENMNDVMKRMKPWMLVTDLGFIFYWSVSLLILLGLEVVPAAWLFKDYDDPIVYAWNWSFFPLDMVLSFCGLLAIRRHARGDPSWRPLAAFSLALTFCAGFMAVSFWAIRLDFDPSWWAANLFLAIWPLYFLPHLARSEESGDVG